MDVVRGDDRIRVDVLESLEPDPIIRILNDLVLCDLGKTAALQSNAVAVVLNGVALNLRRRELYVDSRFVEGNPGTLDLTAGIPLQK